MKATSVVCECVWVCRWSYQVVCLSWKRKYIRKTLRDLNGVIESSNFNIPSGLQSLTVIAISVSKSVQVY